MSGPGEIRGESDPGPAAERWLSAAPARHALFSLDADGDVDSWSASATKLYGLEAEEALGRPLETLLADEDGLDGTTEDLLRLARHGSAEAECWHEPADGSPFWASLSLSAVYEDGLCGYAAIATDLTPWKQRERTLERQNDRLKEFTDILSHDLRNPLNVVDGRLDLYRATGDEAHLDVMDETVSRMERLVEDLLRVARQGRIVDDPEPTDLGEVVRVAWEGTGSPAAPATLEVADVGTVAADPDRLSELLANLFRNAVEHASTSPDSQAPGDAVGRGGRGVTVRVGRLEDGFYVEDDGGGIPDAVRGDVFDHGFTTSDDGSGYGLSVVRTIVGAHEWDVSVREAEGGGARFEITGVEFLD